MKRFLIIGVWLSIIVLYFEGVIFDNVILIERDLFAFNYPWRQLWVDLVKNFQFPFWNPYLQCGVPLFASLQPAVFYPLSLLYLVMPFDLAFNYLIIIHFFLSGLFTYFLVRKTGGSETAAVFSGVAFGLGGYLIALIDLLSTLFAVPWFPLVLLFYYLSLAKDLATYAVFSGLTLCVMFLAGGMELVLFSLATVTLMTLYPQALFPCLEDTPAIKRRWALFSISLFTFLGLAMVQLLPFAEYMSQSVRWGGISYKEATVWSLWPRDLLYFLIPDIYGYRAADPKAWSIHQNWLKGFYIGIIPFAFAILYFIKDFRRKSFLLAIIIFSVILALGKFTPVYWVFHKYIPLFNTIRYPVKFMFFAAFFICLAAGWGVDIFIRGKEDSRVAGFSRALLVFALVSAILFGVINIFREEILQLILAHKTLTAAQLTNLQRFFHNFSKVLFFSLVTGLLAFVAREKRKTAFATFKVLLILLLTADLFSTHHGYYEYMKTDVFHRVEGSVQFVLSDKSLFRIHVLPFRDKYCASKLSIETYAQGFKELFEPNSGMENHIFDIRGAVVPELRRYNNLLTLVRTTPKPDETNLLALTNVKYILSAEPISSKEFDLVKEGTPHARAVDGPVRIYRNRNYLERAFLSRDFRVVSKFKEILSDKNFKPQEVVLLEETPVEFLEYKKLASQPRLPEKADITSYRANRISVKVSCPRPTFLVMSENYYPGWKAVVDGNERKIYRADYTFRAVPLEPGEHRVEFYYDPLSFKLGLGISIISVFGICAYLIRRRRKR